MQTVLIIDTDLGFMFWLGGALNDTGYQTWPAGSVPEASALLRELKIGVDLLIVNPSMAGSTRFIRGLRRTQQNLKVIALIEDEQTRTHPGVDAYRHKPTRVDDTSRSEWVGFVRRVLEGLDNVRTTKASS